MSGIRSGVGLVTGVNNEQLINALIALQRTQVQRLENRLQGFQATDTGLKTLEANVVSIVTSLQQLGTSLNFNSHTVTNSDEGQLKVTAGPKAIPGTFQFQAIREATSHAVLSRGFANADQQSIGSGTLTISTGGGLHQSTLLDSLNGGNGVRRGKIRITDRTGTAADIDLSNTYTVDDVLDAINSNEAIAVTASTLGGRIVLTDTSGAVNSNLTVAELAGGRAAQDLGILKSVASGTLNGDTVFAITGDFTLEQLNDGNGIRRFHGAPDIRITLSDDSTLEINLDDAVNLNDVISIINNHADNNGLVSAELVDGRLRLTDLSGGGGAGVFVVEDINETNVVSELGLDVEASGNQITGTSLSAGINSVLLRNLRGGHGIDELGQLSLTDRSGATAVVDLTGAESLDEVLWAINTAQTGGGIKLRLSAEINASGTGIVVRDTSEVAASNLKIADLGQSTLAAQLGIEVDAAVNSVDSGRLNHRYVGAATSVQDYAPDGGGIAPGSIRITDSAGNVAIIEISSAVKNVGDVLQRLNLATGVSIRADLNATGDGFVIIDEAGGSDPLQIDEVGAGTAGDLRILGEGVLGEDGKYRIDSRFAAVVDVQSADSLNDVVQKINNGAAFLTASVINDGSAFNAQRLSLVASRSGARGRLFIETSGLDLGLNTLVQGQDALLRVGASSQTGFVVASGTNRFDGAITGADVEILRPGAQPAEVTISLDTAKIEKTIKTFVDSYNRFIDSSKELTKFDPETETRGPLNGRGIVLRVQGRLSSLVSRQYFGTESPIRSLAAIGIRVGSDNKLSLNSERLQDVLADNPEAVADFFLTKSDGFADIAKSGIDTLTDPFTGAIALEENSLQSSIDSLTNRIEQLDTILAARRERLIEEFSRMEQIIGEMTSQQQALSSISLLQIAPVGLGVL